MLRLDNPIDEKHRNRIRQCQCAVSMSWIDIEAAHVRYSDAARGKTNPGVGQKPHDKWLVPLSAAKHRTDRFAQHNMNEREFWEGHGVDPLALAEELWAISKSDLSEGAKVEHMQMAVRQHFIRRRR